MHHWGENPFLLNGRSPATDIDDSLKNKHSMMGETGHQAIGDGDQWAILVEGTREKLDLRPTCGIRMRTVSLLTLL
jgi:hypothetical protein